MRLIVFLALAVPNALIAQIDVTWGEYLSGECVGCHQSDDPNGALLPIVGWPPDQLEAALQAYRDGTRVHQVMQVIAGRLSNEEIAALAAYLGSR